MGLGGLSPTLAVALGMGHFDGGQVDEHLLAGVQALILPAGPPS